MEDGLVSIVTSIYNSGKFIARTIESVQAQTYQNWEMLITDDCSSDNGPDIVRDYMKNDNRIKLLRTDVNGGPGKARNVSIANAQGRYIAFIDSDDCWLPEKLELQLAILKSRDCGMTYASYYVSDENDKITGLVKCRKSVKYWRIVCDNAIGFLTMMYDRKKVDDNILMPTIRKRQDWGLNIMLIRKLRVAYGISQPLAIYKVRNNSVSRDKLSLIKYNIAIYHDIVGCSKAASVLMFLFLFIPFYLGKKLLNAFRTLPFRLDSRCA